MVKDTESLSQESVDIPVIETQQINTANLSNNGRKSGFMDILLRAGSKSFRRLL